MVRQEDKEKEITFNCFYKLIFFQHLKKNTNCFCRNVLFLNQFLRLFSKSFREFSYKEFEFSVVYKKNLQNFNFNLI